MKKMLPILFIALSLSLTGHQGSPVPPSQNRDTLLLHMKVKEIKIINEHLLNQIETKINHYELSPKNMEPR